MKNRLGILVTLHNNTSIPLYTTYQIISLQLRILFKAKLRDYVGLIELILLVEWKR